VSGPTPRAQPAARVLSPGGRVGGYVVEHVIGAGGVGQVYAATHEFLGVKVALKVLHQEFRGRVDLVDKMRAEAQLLRKLEHPNLVRVSDAGMTDDGTLWMAMDLLGGESLRAALERQPRLPLPLLVDYASQAAAGLCAAHAQGVIHRDIKPENLFITHGGEVKLLDFGTAKFRELAATAIDAERFATIAYSSPEQLSGEGDGRIDVYALGLIMHEALTGAHYLRRADGTFPPLGELMMLQLSREPAVDQLEPPIAEVVRRATAKREVDRYASMHELAAALVDLGRRYPTPRTAGPVRLPTALHSGGRSVRLSTTLGLALLVAAASSAATYGVEARLASENVVAQPATQPEAAPPQPDPGPSVLPLPVPPASTNVTPPPSPPPSMSSVSAPRPRPTHAPPPVPLPPPPPPPPPSPTGFRRF
jgi:serine/threonine protein kinase